MHKNIIVRIIRFLFLYQFLKVCLSCKTTKPQKLMFLHIVTRTHIFYTCNNAQITHFSY